MALDGIILSKVKDDLVSKLPIRINRVGQTSPTEIVFNIHAETIRTNLVMSFHSVYNHICLSNRNFATYNDPSTFVMVLRKHIQNGIIYDIKQIDYDRYLLLYVKALDELYDEKHYILSVELMGKYANLVLIDEETNRIIDALKKIPPYENTRRTILQGATFTLPDKQDKLNFFEDIDINFDESLVNQLQGFSKVLENEVRHRMSYQSLDEIKKLIKSSHSLYLTKVNDNYEYHIIPLTYLNNKSNEYEIHNGFDELYFDLDEKERIKNITDDISKFVKKQLKHFSTKVDKLNDSLKDALNLDEYKECGDLLYTYGDLNKKGLTEVIIYDKKIKLDPKLSLKDNARKYYQQYTKKRKGRAYIEEQLEIASKEFEYFSSLSEQLVLANFKDALDIKEELSKYGYLKKKNNSKKLPKKKANIYQVKIDGHTITFGKNNTQNDYVSFNYGKNNYTWFHCKQYHGAHVVVDDENPSENIIRTCANIAAYYSGGRLSSSVPVDYCLLKNVKKVPGGKLGFVTYKNYKTIFIDPIKDETLTIESV